MKRIMNLLPVAVAVLAVVYLLSTLTAGVADNLIAPRHETLRMTATECGPYDSIGEPATSDTRKNALAVIAHYLPGFQMVTFEVVSSSCTPTEIGNKIAKLGLKFGARLEIMETDNQGSFLTVLPLDSEHATFYGLIVYDSGSVVVVADLVRINKSIEG